MDTTINEYGNEKKMWALTVNWIFEICYQA